MLNVKTGNGSYEVQWYPNQFFAEVFKEIDCEPGEYGFEYFATLPVDDDTSEQDIVEAIEYRETIE